MLRAKLDATGETQAGAETRIGAGAGWLSRVLTGERGISVESAAKIEEAWGIPASAWARPAMQPTPPHTASDFAAPSPADPSEAA